MNLIELKDMNNERSFEQKLNVWNGNLLKTLDNDERIILILSIKTFTADNRRDYLRVTGFDIKTRSIVNIIDTNGKQFFAHSFKEDLLKLKEDCLISAKFKYVEDDSIKNNLRIVSDYRVLGDSNFLLLKKKYKHCEYDIEIMPSFDEVIDYANNHGTARSFLVNFTNTKVINGHIKMGNCFVNVIDSLKKINSDLEGFNIAGIVLISCRVKSDGKIQFFSDRIFANYGNENQIKSRHENNIEKIRKNEELEKIVASQKNLEEIEKQKEHEYYEDLYISELTYDLSEDDRFSSHDEAYAYARNEYQFVEFKDIEFEDDEEIPNDSSGRFILLAREGLCYGLCEISDFIDLNNEKIMKKMLGKKYYHNTKIDDPEFALSYIEFPIMKELRDDGYLVSIVDYNTGIMTYDDFSSVPYKSELDPIIGFGEDQRIKEIFKKLTKEFETFCY